MILINFYDKFFFELKYLLLNKISIFYFEQYKTIRLILRSLEFFLINFSSTIKIGIWGFYLHLKGMITVELILLLNALRGPANTEIPIFWGNFEPFWYTRTFRNFFKNVLESEKVGFFIFRPLRKNAWDLMQRKFDLKNS